MMMEHRFPMASQRVARRGLTTLAAATLMAGAAWAQYKVVGPDGKITYTDTPPPSANAKPVARAGGGGSVVETDSLPYELRQVVGRFPVTLYTTANCSACDAARNLLRQRGVPFAEKTISTNEDVNALVQAEGGNDLPVARIGGQQLKGFHSADWNGYLDAAGYPKQSRLPPGYRFAEPAPLVPLAPKPAPATAARTPAPPPAPTPAPPPADPSGIRF
jgi:glutaredoxin